MIEGFEDCEDLLKKLFASYEAHFKSIHEASLLSFQRIPFEEWPTHLKSYDNIEVIYDKYSSSRS